MALVSTTKLFFLAGEGATSQKETKKLNGVHLNLG